MLDYTIMETPSRKAVIMLPNTLADVTVQARFRSWGVFADCSDVGEVCW